ncbi:MAG: phytanoyl-CoA dioxygenase family protein [SAR202 cluster bacterium]|nr:phytanoyl-CoA dioxygenase family protein [SAR202 cluster bacterium]
MTTLTRSHMDVFQEQGYVVVKGLLSWELDLAPVVDEYSRLLGRLAAKWHKEGRLSQTFSGLPFGQRLTRIMGEVPPSEVIQHLDISLPQSNIAEDTPFHFGPAVFNLLRSPRLLDAVEEFIGPEILSNPIQHVRIKPPERLLPKDALGNSLVAKTSWHQDLGVGLAEADRSNILTVWFPLTEATVENGCLVTVPGSHEGELALHCLRSPKQNGLHIPDQYLGPNQTPVPMSPGDVYFMHTKTMHSSLPNNSDTIRWSFDIRYQPIGHPTGRPFFPGFVARSRARPETELHDAAEWRLRWEEVRSNLARNETPTFRRWRLDDPRCA